MKMKWYTGLLALILAAALTIPALAAGAFTDVPDGAWYNDAVNYCADQGWVSGYANKTFKPNNNITRAELAAVINKELKLDTPAENTFQDVAAGQWYTAPVLNCVKAGIITGYSAKTFGPQDKVTREQAAVILAKAFNVEKLDGRSSFKDDGKISSWAAGSVKAMNRLGFIAGVGDNMFAPKDYVSRAAICQILYRGTYSIPTEGQFSLIRDRYTEANELYSNVITFQESLDKNDMITEKTGDGEKIYYRVPQADTKKEFREYCGKFYTEEVAEEIVGYHKYIERDGKLYMDQSLGLGGPLITAVEIFWNQNNTAQYTLELTEYYDGNTESPVYETVHLLRINGEWVFDKIICADDGVVIMPMAPT